MSNVVPKIINSATVSHFLGEMTWLLTQSSLHRELSIKSLEWLIMPPLALEQFYLFRDGDKPVGLALWAKCRPEVAKKLQCVRAPGTPLLSFDEWQSGDETWLVDLICPFATTANRQRDVMIADLIVKPLSGVALHIPYSTEDGRRHVKMVNAAAGERLQSELAALVESASTTLDDVTKKES